MDDATHQATRRRLAESTDTRSLTVALAEHGLRHEPGPKDNGERRIIDAASGGLIDTCDYVGGWAIVWAREDARQPPSTESAAPASPDVAAADLSGRPGLPAARASGEGERP